MLLFLLLCSCKKSNIQEQLNEKFGKYQENPSPENHKLYKAYNKSLKLWNTPYGEAYIETSLGKAHVIVSGPEDAPALVLLHGMNATSTMWYPNAKALSKNYRIYAIDHLLEPGKSHSYGKVKNFNDIIDWYHEVFLGLKLQKFSLIGASKGGWLAINIALKNKVQIKNLILLSPAQTFTTIKPDLNILPNLFYAISPNKKNLMKALETMSNNPNNINQNYIDQYYIVSQKASLNKFILQMTPYSNNQLQELKMPTLLLIGDNDIINNKKSIKKAKESIPNVHTKIIKDAGHFLSVDQPKIVNMYMLDFLNSFNDIK